MSVHQFGHVAANAAERESERLRVKERVEGGEKKGQGELGYRSNELCPNI